MTINSQFDSADDDYLMIISDMLLRSADRVINFRSFFVCHSSLFINRLCILNNHIITFVIHMI